MNGAWLTLLIVTFATWDTPEAVERAMCGARLKGISDVACTSDAGCVREASRRLRGACAGRAATFACMMRGPPVPGHGVPRYCGCATPLAVDVDANGHKRYRDDCF